METLSRFKDKLVMITGAGSGIGKAVAIRIAKEGGNLILHDINNSNLEKTSAEVSSNCNKLYTICCDIQDEEFLKREVKKTVDDFGFIHALSHNAGILKSYKTDQMKVADFKKILDINVTGTFIINKILIPHLIKNERSYIVNMSSNAEFHPHPYLSAYSASKGAIKSFTRSIAIEYFKHGLRANSIQPGCIKTQLSENFTIPSEADTSLLNYLTPFGQPYMVTPDKISGAIAMLCSDDSFHITGTELILDGGRV